MNKPYIDYQKILALSKLPASRHYGPTRTKLLTQLETMLNTNLSDINFTGTSVLALVAHTSNISSPHYWKFLGDQIESKINTVNHTNCDALSMIFHIYVSRFPAMPDSFFETLETKLVKNIRHLMIRSNSQCISSFAKRKKAMDSTLEAFERNINEILPDMKEMDLSNIGHSLSLYDKVCTGKEFMERYCAAILEKKDKLSFTGEILIGQGLVSRMVFLEEYFQYLYEKYQKPEHRLNEYENKALAGILHPFHRDLEIPFIEKVHEVKVLEQQSKGRKIL